MNAKCTFTRTFVVCCPRTSPQFLHARRSIGKTLVQQFHLLGLFPLCRENNNKFQTLKPKSKIKNIFVRRIGCECSSPLSALLVTLVGIKSSKIPRVLHRKQNVERNLFSNSFAYFFSCKRPSTPCSLPATTRKCSKLLPFLATICLLLRIPCPTSSTNSNYVHAENKSSGLSKIIRKGQF